VIRDWLRAFWLNRLTPRDAITLTQRNVYIMPTRPGWAMALTLLVLLIASINYQLNLGYVLTFLLAGSALVGMHVCHATLRGLTLKLKPCEPVFLGSNATVSVLLSSESRNIRYGIGVAVWRSDRWNFANVPASGTATVHVSFLPPQRGLHPLPLLTAQTRYPLGTFRVWNLWRPAATVLVYPHPEDHPPPLPPGRPSAGAAVAVHHEGAGEFDGVRAYRRGDPLKTVVWKKAAKSDTLVSRDTQQVQRVELWLDLAQTSVPAGTAAPLERRLSRLCAWVLMADLQKLHYGLRLGDLEIPPGSGDTHTRTCLQALALY